MATPNYTNLPRGKGGSIAAIHVRARVALVICTKDILSLLRSPCYVRVPDQAARTRRRPTATAWCASGRPRGLLRTPRARPCCCAAHPSPPWPGTAARTRHGPGAAQYNKNNKNNDNNNNNNNNNPVHRLICTPGCMLTRKELCFELCYVWRSWSVLPIPLPSCPQHVSQVNLFIMRAWHVTSCNYQSV